MAKENREADRTRRTSDDPKKTSAQPKPKSEVSTGKPLTLNSVSSRPSPRVQRRAKATHGHRNRGWVGQTFAVVGILAVLGAGLWWITQKSHPTKPYTATNVAANGAGANEGSGSNRTPNSTPLKGDGHTPGTSVSSRTSQRKPTVTAPATSVVVTPQPIQGSHLNYLVKTSLPLHVVLTASSRLWTTVTADGKSLDNGGGEILSSGQSQAFEAKGNLTFVIGNLPAATFVVNGTPITLPNVGHVLNVGFLKTKP